MTIQEVFAIIISLNGLWKYKAGAPCTSILSPKDRGNYGENNYFNLPEIELPACWNIIRGYKKYEGIFWFYKKIPKPEFSKDEKIFIHFKGVNYYCKVWLNEKLLGKHEGGFLHFSFKIDEDSLKEENLLSIYVENFRRKDRIPAEVYDWFNCGGIYRDVELHILNKKRINHAYISTQTITDKEAEIKVKYELNHSFNLSYEVIYKNNSITEGECKSNKREGQLLIKIENPKLWSPDNPELYQLKCYSEKEEIFNTNFGIRTIKIKGKNIYLNDEPIKLRGINLHEELLPYGRAIPMEKRREDILRIKKLGFNAIRTAHYPHDESILKLADKEGILIMEEIPVYWNIDFKNKKVYKLACNMLGDMIHRDYNHPSVIIWSAGNEIPTERKETVLFMNSLMKYARELDITRVITYVASRFLVDPLRKYSDICCLNCYIGWYWGDEKYLKPLLDTVHNTCEDKPWLITEFGACAKQGFRSQTFKKYSEDRQSQLLSHYIKTLNSTDYIAGWFIWLYRDFMSPMRLNKYQRGFNRKGIVDERNIEKLSYQQIPNIIYNSWTPKFAEKYVNKLYPSKFVIPIINIIKQLEKFLSLIGYGVAQHQLKRTINKFYHD